MPNGASSNHAPLCPRCGYDQSGLIASWTQACPLIATCTECGCSFDSADSIHPTRKRLRWLYEHRRVRSIPAAIATLAMLAWPPFFWKRVRPEHEVRVRMLACWVALLLLGTLSLGSLMLWVTIGVHDRYDALLHRIVHPHFYRPRPAYGLPAVFALNTLVDTVKIFLGVREVHTASQIPRSFPSSILAAPAFISAAVAVLIALPSHWRQEQATPKHFVRIAAYSLAPALVVYAAFCFSLVFLWAERAIIVVQMFLQREGSQYLIRASSSPIARLVSGQFYLTLLLITTVWQVIFLASALRTGLRLRAWLGLWILACACGFIGIASVSGIRVLWEMGVW